MNHERTQGQEQAGAPTADVMQRVADALEEAETGEAATVTLVPESETPLLPRRDS